MKSINLLGLWFDAWLPVYSRVPRFFMVSRWVACRVPRFFWYPSRLPVECRVPRFFWYPGRLPVEGLVFSGLQVGMVGKLVLGGLGQGPVINLKVKETLS